MVAFTDRKNSAGRGPRYCAIWSVRYLRLNTWMQPVRQPGIALFAGAGTSTQLFLALAATEWPVPVTCMVLMGGPGSISFGTLKVGTS